MIEKFTALAANSFMKILKQKIRKEEGSAQKVCARPSCREWGGCLYPFLPLMSALGALEVAIHATGHIIPLVVLHLAGESGTLGAEIVIALDEVALEIADLENLHPLEGAPELVRPRHLHHHATTRKERCFPVANLEGANSSSVEFPRTKLHVQRLIAHPERHPCPRFKKDFNAVSHFRSPPIRLEMLGLATLYQKNHAITSKQRNLQVSYPRVVLENFSFLFLTESGISFYPEKSVRFGRRAKRGDI